ncbi:MAG: 3'-5' exonuclease, partial [Anaerolineae bacterium]
DERLPGIFQRYEDARRRSQALDFDDLIVQAVRLLETQEEARAALHQRFHWLCVDEYQDIALGQYRLLRLLAAGGANLAVIGDPDQAIYGFRGADRRFFLNFAQDYPGARRLHLSQNYRSTQMILDAAAQVIAANRDERVPLQAVQVLADFVQQVRIEIFQTPTDRAEAETVVHQIEQMVGGTSYFSLDSGRVAAAPTAPHAFADFAVLFRLSAQSRLLVEAFERSGIPFQHVGQTPLLEQPAVHHVLAYLWLAVQPATRIHLETVLGSGKGAFASGAMGRLNAQLAASPAGLCDALLAAALAADFSVTQRERLRSLAVFWQSPEMAPGQPAARRIEAVYAFACRQASLRGESTEAEQIAQLARRAAPFDERLVDFLEAQALQGETDAYDPRADRVTLMTLHASKGLEFPVVFIVGCEESLLPYARPGAAADIEEERRLFYVGMTRARQRLILTHAASRFLFGRSMQNAPSRFVDDIAAALKALREMERPSPRPAPVGVQLALF